MLPILVNQQFSEFWSQRGVLPIVRTDFAPQRLHRILILVAGCIEPPFNRRETKLNALPADGMMPFLAAKLLSCSWSSPRSGGAASNGPITLKRNRAHRSWERASPETLDIAFFIFFARRCGDVRLLALMPVLCPPASSAGVGIALT